MQLAVDFLETREHGLRFGSGVDVVTTLVKNHGSGFEGDCEVVDEVLLGLRHATATDAVVMNREGGEIPLHLFQYK